MITLTVTVISSEYKRLGYISEKLKSFLQAGIVQNCLSVFALHNFDVDFDVDCVKNIFSGKNRLLLFATTFASITLKFNLFQYKFDEIYVTAIINK